MMININTCVFYYIDDDDDDYAYVKDIQFFPFALRDDQNPPNEYLPTRIPTIDNDKARFIKPVWTRQKNLAATSFEIREKRVGSGERKQSFCPKHNIFTMVNQKDDAKVVDIHFNETIKQTNDWSCTGDLTSSCGTWQSGKMFFCWQWKAKDTGTHPFSRFQGSRKFNYEMFFAVTKV